SEESRSVGVVTRGGLACDPGGGVQNEHRATFVGRVREDVDDRADPDVDAGLLCSFAHRREPRVLTDVEVAAGQRPATAPGFHRAAHEEQPVVAEHGNSYGDLRVGVVDVATGGAVTAGDATDVAGGHRRPALRA